LHKKVLQKEEIVRLQGKFRESGETFDFFPAFGYNGNYKKYLTGGIKPWMV